MRTVLTALTALMFLGRALPAEALTLRDIGYWASENSQNLFWSIWNWLVDWWMFHHCLVFGECDFWDISVGFLLLDAFYFIALIFGALDWLERQGYSHKFIAWRFEKRVLNRTEKGDVDAHFGLGRIFFKPSDFIEDSWGQPTVLQDTVKAFAWLTVAARQGHQEAEEWQEDVKACMSREQILKAQKLSSELWEKYVVPFQKD